MPSTEVVLLFGAGSIFGVLFLGAFVAIEEWRERRRPKPPPVTPAELRTLARELGRIGQRVHEVADTLEQAEPAGERATA